MPIIFYIGVVFPFMGLLSLHRCHFYFFMSLKEPLTFLSLSNPGSTVLDLILVYEIPVRWRVVSSILEYSLPPEMLQSLYISLLVCDTYSYHWLYSVVCISVLVPHTHRTHAHANGTFLSWGIQRWLPHMLSLLYWLESVEAANFANGNHQGCPLLIECVSC